MTDSVPEKLGKYKIIEEVGRGGFAAVYKAVDTTLDRTVALKVLAPHLLWDPTFVQRFQREAEVAANLNHPNIVTIYEVSQIEGIYFIAMQFLAGRTVSQILKAEGLLLVSRVQAIVEQIASALDYAHARGFVHRDIKPSNIIVADDGRATLTDFGLVKAGEGTKLSTTGVVFGTPEYMSPEQAEGKKLDARSDIYSLGVVLFEMLAGQAPFVADTTPAVMYKHVHEPPPLGELPSNLPQGVVAVVEKALAKDPADRYQSAGEMVGALRKVMAEAPVPAKVAPPPPPEVIEEAAPFWQKAPLWGWGVIGGLILLAVVGGVLLTARGVKPVPTATVVAEITTPGAVVIPTVPTTAPAPAMATPVSPTATTTSKATPTRTVTPIPPTATPRPPTATPKATPVAVLLTATPTATPASWIEQEWVILRSFPAPGARPSGIVRVEDNLWISVPGDGRLYRLDLEGHIVAELDLPIDYCPGRCQGGLAWDGESLWFASGKTVHQLDPISEQELAAFGVDLDSIVGIAWDGQALLMIDGEGNLVRYDRAGQRLRRLAIRSPHGGVTGMTWVEGELWVEGIFGALLRFNSGFASIGSFNLGQCGAATFPYYLALYWDGESLWLADPEGNLLSQCAPAD